MKFFGKLKTHILVIFITFSTLPLVLLGIYLLLHSYVHRSIFMFASGIASICAAGLSLFFIIHKIISELKPMERAVGQLFNTLSQDEQMILTEAVSDRPSKIVFALLDYIAGKHIVSGSSVQQRNLFEAVSDCTEEIIWRRDEDGDSYYIPEIWKTRHPGIDLKNGTDLEAYIHPNDVDEFRSAMEIMTARPGRKYAINVQLKMGDRYVSVGITARSSQIGGKVCAAGAFTDTEKIEEFENTIKEKYLMYHFALRAVSDILYEVDVDEDKYSIINPDRWTAMFDIPINGDFTFHRATYAELVHPDSIQGFADRFGNYDHLLFMPDRSITYDYRIKHKNGDWVWVRHSVTSVKDEDGHVLKIVGHISDINEKKRQEFREMYDHKHDSLTGAFLRSTLEADFMELVNVQKKPTVIMSVDIDNFKDIVDYYGYRAGDLVLRQFVHTLWECQTGRCSVGRIGNDDFVIIMKDFNEHNTPEEMAKRIISFLTEPFIADNKQIVVTASIGWAEYGKDGGGFEELIAKAESARMTARTMGKNRYTAYEEEV